MSLLEKITPQRLFFAFAVGAVAMLRLTQCLEMPANSTDALRHIFYGLWVGQEGLRIAEVPLFSIDPLYQRIGWSTMPFNYPPVVLYFNAAVMALSPTLFAYKAALTFLDLLSSYLIYRHTGEKWLGFFYWASPTMIWWTSREGQFESLQNFLVVAAIVSLPHRRILAFLLLALAIQTKLFAVVLLPFFALSSWRERRWWQDLAAFAGGFLATAIAFVYYSPFQNFNFQTLRYNPYYWNFLDTRVFTWNPRWLVISNQLTSYLLLILLVVLLWRHRGSAQGWLQGASQVVGPLGFLAVVKSAGQAQFWYMTAMPSLLLPLENRRLRLILFGTLPLLDMRSLSQIIGGPWGHLVSHRGIISQITTLTPLDTLGQLGRLLYG